MFWIWLLGALVGFGTCEFGFSTLMGMDKDNVSSKKKKIIKRIACVLIMLIGIAIIAPFITMLVRHY